MAESNGNGSSKWLQIVLSLVVAIALAVAYVHTTFVTYRTYHDDRYEMNESLREIRNELRRLNNKNESGGQFESRNN